MKTPHASERLPRRRRSMRRFGGRLLSLAIALSGMAGMASRAQSADLPAMVVDVDEQTGKKSFRFHRYDRAETLSGKVYEAHPAWTSDLGVKRGAPLAKISRFSYVKFNEQFSGGGLRIPSSQLRSLVYYEEMLSEQFYEHEKLREYEAAAAALAELKDFNKNWSPETVARMERGLNFAAIQKKLLPTATPMEQESAEKELAALATNQPDLPGLKQEFLKRYLARAEESLEAKDWIKTRQLLDIIEIPYPNTPEAGKLRKSIVDGGQKLLDSAAENARGGKHREAHDLALKAVARWPSAEFQKEAARYLASYPVVKVAAYETPSSHDPYNAILPLERQMLGLLFDRIVEPDENGLRFAIGPLVESLTIEDLGREARLKLRPKQRFSDGGPISGHDVVNSVDLLRLARGAGYDPELVRYLRGARINPKDPNEVTIQLHQHPRPESLLTFFVTPSKHLPAPPRPGDPYSRRPVGSGPFIVPSGADRTTRLVANPMFRDAGAGKPYVKEMVFPLYTSQAAGAPINDLQRGEVHLLVNPSPTQLVQLQNQTKLFRTRPFLSNSVYVLLLNHRRTPFQNLALREAILRGIDRQRILDQHFAAGGAGGFAHAVVSGPFPPQSPAADPTLKPVEPDAVLARSRVAAVPVSQMREFSLKFPIGDEATELAVQQMRKDLAAVGIAIRTEPKAPNDLIHEVAEKHDFDIAYWRIDHVNVLFNIAGMFDTSDDGMKSPGGTNTSGYSSQRLTQLFVDLREERKDDLVWQRQRRIHRYFYNEVVFVPLWRLDNFVVYTNRLTGRDANGATHELPVDGTRLFRRPEDWYLKPAFE